MGEKDIVVVQKGNPDNIVVDTKTAKLLELENADYALARCLVSLRDSIDALRIQIRNK